VAASPLETGSGSWTVEGTATVAGVGKAVGVLAGIGVCAGAEGRAVVIVAVEAGGGVELEMTT